MNNEENDRDTRLSNFNETHKSNLEDWMKRQDLQIRANYLMMNYRRLKDMLKVEIMLMPHYMHLSLLG